MLLHAEWVERFARASGDLNPLHRDDRFARRTPFGRPIAHGCLATLAVLASCELGLGPASLQVSATFLRPVHPGTRYRVRADATVGRAIVEYGGEPALVVEHSSGGEPGPRPVPDTSWRSLAEHEPDVTALQELLAELGPVPVPDVLVRGLGWASWLAGTHHPGPEGMLGAVKVRTGPPTGPARSVHVSTDDTRTGMVAARAARATPDGTLEVDVRGLRWPAVSLTTRATASAGHPTGSRMSGRHVVVTGAGRGLGASLTAALAQQGATVWAVHSRSDHEVAQLQQRLPGTDIRNLRCDLTRPDQVVAAGAVLGDATPALDGLVLNATPPLARHPVHPDTIGPAIADLERAMLMTVTPYSAWHRLLGDDAWLVIPSSEAIDDPPAEWWHYAAAKTALEHAFRHWAARGRTRLHQPRLPLLRTDLANGPAAALVGVPAEQVAADIVRWIIGQDRRTAE